MKKGLTIGIALITTLSLAACGNSQAKSDKAKKDSSSWVAKKKAHAKKESIKKANATSESKAKAESESKASSIVASSSSVASVAVSQSQAAAQSSSAVRTQQTETSILPHKRTETIQIPGIVLIEDIRHTTPIVKQTMVIQTFKRNC